MSQYPEEVSLRQLFRNYKNKDQFILVKNVPNEATTDSIQCYIEVILKCDVIELYAVHEVKGYHVAVVDRPVKDFQAVSKLLEARKLEGSVVEFCLLGQAEGLFIRAVPEECSNQFLELYFESPKSGGEEGAVAEVKSCDCCPDRMVVIIFVDIAVSRRILEKPSHPSLEKYRLSLDPYFPAFHDAVFRKHPTSQTSLREKRIWDNTNSPNPSQDITSVAVSPADLNKISHDGILNVIDNFNLDVHTNTDLPKRPLEAIPNNPHAFKMPSASKMRIFCEGSDRSESSYETDEHENAQISGSTEFLSGMPCGYALDLSSNRDASSCESMFSGPDQRYESRYSGRNTGDVDHSVQGTLDQSEKQRTGQKTTIPKTVFHMMAVDQTIISKGRNHEESSQMPHKQHKNFTTRKHLPVESNHSSIQECVSFPLDKTSIILLKINRFTKQCDNCNVVLIEKQGIVKFHGSKDAIKHAQIRMYETLTNKKEVSKVLPKHHIQFISESTGYIRTQLTSKKVGAVITTNTDQSTVHCFAFSVPQAERALEFITNGMESRQVKLRDGQPQCLQGQDWGNILQKIDKHVLITILDDGKSLDIISFDAICVYKTWEKIIRFLNASAPKHTVAIDLKGAAAKCFKYYFLEDLQHKIRSENGTIDCKEHGHDNIKISVVGDQAITKLTSDTVKQIWHEKIDFKKITSNENELWLVMKGLATWKAKDFFEKFERENKCFIDINEKGEVYLPVVHVQRIEEKSVDRSISKLDETEGAVGEPIGATLLKHHSANKAHELQFGLSEEEAMELVIENSKSQSALFLPLRDSKLKSSAEELGIHETIPTTFRERVHPMIDRASLPPKAEEQKLSKQFGHTKITVKLGTIATERSAAKVNVVSPSQDIERDSVISKAFVAAGGRELVQMYEDAKQNSISNVVVTQGCGALRCDIVLHVTLKKNIQHPKSVLVPVMRECFQQCSFYGCKYVTFPPLGVGRLYNYPPDAVARCMVDEIIRQTQTRFLFKEIMIVIYDDATYTVFNAILEKSATVNLEYMGEDDNEGSYPQPMQQNRLPTYREKTNTTRTSSGSYRQTNSAPTKEKMRPLGEPPRKDPGERTKSASDKRRDEPAVKFKIKVFSKDKAICERGRNELVKQLKQKFLYQKILEKRWRISDGCKKSIRDILKRWNVMSFPAARPGSYVIKGEEKSVIEANAEILKVLLDEGKENDMTFQRRKSRRRELKSKPEDFAKHMAFEHEPEIPEYWENFKPGSPIRSALTALKTMTKNFIKVELKDSDPVYKAIIKVINTTWESSKVGQGNDAKGLDRLSYHKMQVTKVQRVENMQLFDKYLHHRKHVFVNMCKMRKTKCTSIGKLPGSIGSAVTEGFETCHVFRDELCSEVNEHFFFHGTTKDVVDVICDTGLDCRLGSHNAMYGAGIYGAESPTKADQYADTKDNRSRDKRRMFLMRMTLGESYLCTAHNPPKYRRPPCANMQCLSDACKHKSHGSFDSVVGQSGRLFREFVVYQAEQCYPEYLITYNRV